MRSVAFYTLGCKVNQYETDALEEIFQKSGYEIKEFSDRADIYIINTCTVTNMADRKSRQILHRAKKKNPNAVIVATGCYVQASAEAVAADPNIDLIVGNNCKTQILDLVEDYFEGHEKKVEVIDINHTDLYETMEITKVAEHTRAYIKIQDGCNQFCSYCIIPYARGRVRSRKPQDIMDEVSKLAVSGYKEIVLTGIHISSYGKDFTTEDQWTADEALICLIEALADVKGIERIRFGSFEPRIITEAFAKRLAAIDKICPHFHLSLQSGCDETLKRMNRHYTADEYYEKCLILRKYFDRPAITTDVIVGFPGETTEEFETTRNFLKKTAFSEMHIFKYSVRKGTRAAGMENQIAEPVKTERSNVLLKLNEQMSLNYKELCNDKVLEVLLEEKISTSKGDLWVGHSKEYIKCAIASDEALQNKIIKCRIKEVLTEHEDFVFCEIID